jgi:hypothetical protein
MKNGKNAFAQGASEDAGHAGVAAFDCNRSYPYAKRGGVRNFACAVMSGWCREFDFSRFGGGL